MNLCLELQLLPWLIMATGTSEFRPSGKRRARPFVISPPIARTTTPPTTNLHSPSAFAMLDTFEILTTSGVVLWSRTYVPVGANVINSLIRDVFIEERIQPQSQDAGSRPAYNKDGYTLKWTAAKDPGLIFVVCSTLPHAPIRGSGSTAHGNMSMPSG